MRFVSTAPALNVSPRTDLHPHSPLLHPASPLGPPALPFSVDEVGKLLDVDERNGVVLFCVSCGTLEFLFRYVLPQVIGF